VAFWLFMGIAYAIVESDLWTLEDVTMTGLVITVAGRDRRDDIGNSAVAHSTFAYVV
jgi:hypothetical protein